MTAPFPQSHYSNKQLDIEEISSETAFPTERPQIKSNTMHSECAECVRFEELPQELAYLLGIWDELPKNKKEAILLVLISEELETEFIPG